MQAQKRMCRFFEHCERRRQENREGRCSGRFIWRTIWTASEYSEITIEKWRWICLRETMRFYLYVCFHYPHDRWIIKLNWFEVFKALTLVVLGGDLWNFWILLLSVLYMWILLRCHLKRGLHYQEIFEKQWVKAWRKCYLTEEKDWLSNKCYFSLRWLSQW